MAKSKKQSPIIISDEENSQSESAVEISDENLTSDARSEQSASESQSEREIESEVGIDEDDEQIPIYSSELCKTTGWHNNCGLNCLTHFLLFKLEDGSLEYMFGDSNEYNELLETFQEYYHLIERPTWAQLKALFEEYAVPTDREAILGPVLRKHLGKMLLEDMENQWFAGGVALSEYLRTGKARDVAREFYAANQDWFKDLKARYNTELKRQQGPKATSDEMAEAREELERNGLEVTSKTMTAKVKQIRERNIIDAFLAEAEPTWREEGAVRYANYVGELENNVMVSADQLQLLCERLGIGVEVYTPDSIEAARQNPDLMARNHGAQNLPTGYIWLMRVCNEGLHWEFQHPSQEDDQEQVQEWIDYHNQHYPERYTSKFEANDLLSGKLKISGSGVGKEKTFINYIREHFDLPPIQDCYAKRRSPIHQTTEEAMKCLVKKLQAYVDEGQITDAQQARIFETQFDAFSRQLAQKSEPPAKRAKKR